MSKHPLSPHDLHMSDYQIDKAPKSASLLPNRMELKIEVTKHAHRVQDKMQMREPILFTDLAVITIDELALYESKHESNLRLGLNAYSDSERMWIKRLMLQSPKQSK